MEIRCDIKKLGKGDRRCFQYQGFHQDKTVKTVPQNPTLTQPALVAIPILQVLSIGTYAQPVAAIVPTQPVTTTSEQSQQFPKFCALCMSVGRQWPNNYLLPVHPEWSDQEEQKDLNR